MPTHLHTIVAQLGRLWFRITLAAALAATAAACTGGQKDAGPTATPTQVQRIFASPQQTAISKAGETSAVGQPGPESTVRGGPAPRIFEIGWTTDKGSIAPGEPVTIRLELENVWNGAVEFGEFPASMTLTHVDTRTETSVPIELDSGKVTPGRLEQGETLAVVASVATRVSAGLRPGRYRVKGFQFLYTRQGPGSGQTRTNLGSEALFVVTPQEGALDRTLVVGQERVADGARITLEEIHFTPERTTVSVFAAPLTQSSSAPEPAVAGTSTPVPAVQQGPTPVLTSLADQSSWDRDVTELTAFYALDGGMWRLVVNDSYREAPDGAYLEWSFDPVSVDVKTLEFVIVPRSRPGRDGTLTLPAGGASLSWGWILPLHDPDSEYSKSDLTEWNRTLRDVIWQVPGMAYTYLDEPKNRIRIGMEPRRRALEEMQAAIESVGVPLGAALIDVGCSGIQPWPFDEEDPPVETFLRAVDYSLEVDGQVPYGETVQLKLTLRNVSDEPVDFLTGGRPPHDFVISSPEGEQVWHWKCGKVVDQPLDSHALEPGEEMEFTGEWEQVDNRGEPVLPGTYRVRGVLDMGPSEALVTEPHEVEIVR